MDSPAGRRHGSVDTAARHTILLIQFNNTLGSRTFLDYPTLAAAVDGVCALYEKELKSLNPKAPQITYDVSDLYNFVDALVDISLLVYHEPIHGYLPRDREWVKKTIFSHLKAQTSEVG